MAWLNLAQRWPLHLTRRIRLRTASAEHTTGGWVDRAGDIAVENLYYFLALDIRVGHRHGGEQGAGVGVLRRVK